MDDPKCMEKPNLFFVKFVEQEMLRIIIRTNTVGIGTSA